MMRVFDRSALRRQRTRRAGELAGVDFLLREVCARLAERLHEIRRSFPLALDLGAHGGQLGQTLAGSTVGTLVSADLAQAQLAGAAGPRVVCDEEALPFAEERFDAVLSAMSLHWVNDLPGALIQIRRCLKPDGLFLAALAGGATLQELRETLMVAELEVTGGGAARVSPFTDVRDAGALLQRAGFALPVVDYDRLTVTYDSALALIDEIRRMGEASVLIERPRRPLRRDVLLRTAALYQERFADDRGRVPATFDILYMTAWKPHESQPRALRRGSGRLELAAALGAPSPAVDDRDGHE